MNTNLLPAQDGKQVKPTSTASAVLPDGRIVELVHRRGNGETEFVVWDGGDWTIDKEIQVDNEQRLVPLSAKNNLIQNDVILFPSKPEEYGSEESLLKEIQAYIHKYVDLSPLFEKLVSYYVVLTWIYDNFNELPYLRVRGGFGCGKSRFLQTVGRLCYKPIFASGASSVSSLFRILDSVKGTLIIDESDFKMSDEKSEMVKILNNGNVKGFPVLRSELTPITKEYNPRAFQVFGPKIIATRGHFEDRALESRCLTEEMVARRLREEIQINLPDVYKDEAQQLQNKLLLFRLRNYKFRSIKPSLVDPTIEHRLSQIFVPLLSLINDPVDLEAIKGFARQLNEEMLNERGLDIEAQILEMIKSISEQPDSILTIQAITNQFNAHYGHEYDRRITSKNIGFITRRSLGLQTRKTKWGYVIPMSEGHKLRRLYERYGIETLDGQQRSPNSPRSPVNEREGELGEHGELPTGQRPDPEQTPPTPPTNLPLEP